MKDSINYERKVELVCALQRIPRQNEILIQEYLQRLLKLFKLFQEEIEWNIYTKNSYAFSIDYLTDLIDEFKCLYMTIDGSFDVIIFPEIITAVEYTRLNKIKNYIDSHKFIYLRTISMLQKRELIINTKITHKLPIVEITTVDTYLGFKNKYVLREKFIINIIEIGFYLYSNGNIIYHNGKPLQLTDFIKDLGLFLGEDIKNIHQRIEEMKNRSNPHRFLDSLIKINVFN